MPKNLPSVLPSKSSGASTPSVASSARTSVFSGASRSAIRRSTNVSSSVVRAQREQQGRAHMGPTTSVNRLGRTNEVSTSVSRKGQTTSLTSVYGRSREGIDSQDDKRFEFGRRQIFAKKIEERKKQIKTTKRHLKGNSKKAQSYMRKMVKKYSWKKPIGQKYDVETRKEMKQKIKDSTPYKKFSKQDVEAMNELVDKLE